MNKLVKLSLVGLIIVVVVGCVSSNGLVKEQVEYNKNEGLLYGLNWTGAGAKSTNNIVDICKTILNKDVRCKSPNNYGSAPILSSQGFADGPMGAIAIFNKSEINIDTGCSFPSSSSCTYYKVEVSKGKLATLMGLASSPNEGKCKWSGLNVAGGTTCQFYNWDYRKNNKPAIFF